MKFRHLGTLGAAIIVLVHGFETFSQQMVTFDQRPYPLKEENISPNPAPPPPRADVWDYYSSRGFTSDVVPALSTRAAIYSGIIASDVPDIMADCETANCSWPLVPTLAVCGECGTIPLFTNCDDATSTCTYSTQSGTSIQLPTNSGPNGIFKVAPTNGTSHQMNATDRAYFSIFDILSLTHLAGTNVEVEASECALWFCIQSLLISIADGKQNLTLVGNWSTVKMDFTDSFHGTEYVFADIPPDFNVNPGAQYVVSDNAMTALRGFMASLTFGTVSNDFNMIDYSSDWTEAMWTALPDLPAWMGNVTKSLTNEVRQQGRVADPRAADAYQGHALELAPFVDVHWYWVIYPGVLIVISIYYLFHTIAVGAHDKVSAWKGDSLPMLFCRFDREIHDKIRDGMDVPGGLDDRVGDVKIALYRGENGEWAFKTTEE